MARSPTARVELSKKSFSESLAALLALLALLKAAGAKAGFTVTDQDEETDEDEDAGEDEDEDEEEEDKDDSKSKKGKKSKSKDEDEDDEDEESDDEDEDDEDEESDDEDEDDEDEDDEDETPPLKASSLKKVKAALQDVLDNGGGRKDAVSLLTKFKVEKVSDLGEDQVALFVKAAAKAVKENPKAKAKGKSSSKK